MNWEIIGTVASWMDKRRERTTFAWSLGCICGKLGCVTTPVVDKGYHRVNRCNVPDGFLYTYSVTTAQVLQQRHSLSLRVFGWPSKHFVNRMQAWPQEREILTSQRMARAKREHRGSSRKLPPRFVLNGKSEICWRTLTLTL